jgi:rRNA-processing protein FCF1
MTVHNTFSQQAGGIGAVRDGYLDWVHQTEITLRELFEEPNLLELHTERYWRISEIRDSLARPWDLLRAEADVQAARLNALADEIDETANRFGSRGALFAIPDTNVFMHFHLFDVLPWRDILGAERVQIVVPIAVIEELDHLKIARENRVRRRAQKTLMRLDPYLDGRAKLEEGVTLEVLLDSNPDRRVAADTRILNTCRMIAAAGADRVVVVTGDTAMRVRAHAMGLTAVVMPEDLRLPLDGDATDGG